MRHPPASSWVRHYQSRYKTLHQQALRTLRHPTVPLFVFLGVAVWVTLALVHVWVRMQLVFVRKAIKQEQYIQRTLVDQKKRADLAQAAYQGHVSPQAQEELEMIYPPRIISLSLPKAASAPGAAP